MRASAVPDAPDAPEKRAIAMLSEHFYDATRAQDRSSAEQALLEMFSRRWSCPGALHLLFSGIMTALQQYALRRGIAVRPDFERLLTEPLYRHFEDIDHLRHTLPGELLPLLFQSEGRASMRLSERVRNYIENHISGDLRVEVIAREFFISPSYLAQRFRADVGVAISGYIEGRRIERSKALLVQNQLNITEIAARTGYQDPAYFSRAFKRCTGITPKKYQTLNVIRR